MCAHERGSCACLNEGWQFACPALVSSDENVLTVRICSMSISCTWPSCPHVSAKSLHTTASSTESTGGSKRRHLLWCGVVSLSLSTSLSTSLRQCKQRDNRKKRHVSPSCVQARRPVWRDFNGADWAGMICLHLPHRFSCALPRIPLPHVLVKVTAQEPRPGMMQQVGRGFVCACVCVHACVCVCVCVCEAERQLEQRCNKPIDRSNIVAGRVQHKRSLTIPTRRVPNLQSPQRGGCRRVCVCVSVSVSVCMCVS